MMEYLVIIALVISISIGVLIFNSISANKKLKLKLTNSFGKPPKEMECEFESIRKYYSYKEPRSDNACSIDDITWGDLDMNKVFERINVCLTSVGEEYLYACLHEPQFEESKLLERERFIAYLKEHPEERLQMQIYLAKVGKVNYNGIPSFIYNAPEKLLKRPSLCKLLALLPVFCIITIFINPSVGVMCLAASFLINLVVYYRTKRKIEVELSSLQYLSSILRYCGKICNIKNAEPESFLLKLKQKYEVFKSLQGKVSGLLRKGVTEMEIIFEYVKILFLYDIMRFNSAMRKITTHIDDFHDLYKIVGEIDVSICVLSYRESLPFFSIPEFHNENCIKFEEAYHPLIPNPVVNSGAVKNDSIITGSNASGKSTFIKALAVNGILAQTIYTCAAKKFTIKFSLVITSMAIHDNISKGESYFIAEIKSIKRILDKIQTVACICFIDEILRGTNTIERIAASASVLKYLSEKDCLCLVASHDIELTSILKDRYDNYNFCEQITDDGLIFDYKLKSGPSQTKNAIKLLHYMDFDRDVVKNAEDFVAGFESTKIWGSVG